MTTKKETKHDRFLRLAENRVARAENQLRLISQLASRDYEYYPEEAEVVVRHLDEAVRHIAKVFRVEYATRIGKAGTQTTNGARAIGVTLRKAPVLDEIECMKVLDLIRDDNPENIERARSILRSAIVGKEAA